MLGACGGGDEPSAGGPAPTPTADTGPVRILVAPFMGYAPLFIAEAEGYFDELDVPVELVEVRSANDVFPVFLEGQIDVWAGASGPALFNAMAAGEDIRIVAERGIMDPDGCPYGAIAVHQDLLDRPDWGSAESLRGLRISAALDAMVSAYYFDTLLAEAGLGRDDVVIQELDRGAVVEAMMSRQVDAALEYEPRITQIMQAAPSGVWKPGGEVIPGVPVGVTVFGPRLLREERDLGVRVLAAYLLGARAYNEGKTDDNVAFLAEAIGLDESLLRAMCWQPVRDDGLLEDVDAAVELIEYGVDQGLVDEVLSPDRFWEPSLVEDANRLLEERG